MSRALLLRSCGRRVEGQDEWCARELGGEHGCRGDKGVHALNLHESNLPRAISKKMPGEKYSRGCGARRVCGARRNRVAILASAISFDGSVVMTVTLCPRSASRALTSSTWFPCRP